MEDNNLCKIFEFVPQDKVFIFQLLSKKFYHKISPQVLSNIQVKIHIVYHAKSIYWYKNKNLYKLAVEEILENKEPKWTKLELKGNVPELNEWN